MPSPSRPQPYHFSLPAVMFAPFACDAFGGRRRDSLPLDRWGRESSLNSGFGWIEMALQRVAVIGVALLQAGGFGGELRHPLGEARLEHESERAFEPVRLHLGVARRLERAHVRPVRQHG